LPAALQSAVRLSPAHVVVLLVVVLCAFGATLWKVQAARGHGEPLPAQAPPAALVTPTASGTPTAAGAAAIPRGAPTSGSAPTSAFAATGTGAAAGAPAGAASPGTLVVDVTGKVRRPGIATLPAGARVVDALRAAGGARHGVALGTLNLARPLADGEQIVVGIPPPRGAAETALGSPSAGVGATKGTRTGPATPMVDVNAADQTTLEELPGIGPVTARAILDYRTKNGPFGSVDDLLGVSGIGGATLAKIAPYVTL
jgi:competence protein ComEA